MQSGANAFVVIGFESTYGTSPSDDGFKLPVNYGEGVEGKQSINQTNTIRGDRNPEVGFRGNRDVSGPVPVPIDSVCLPYWLTACFGDPTTTGASSPYSHEWKVASTQPSFTYEKGFTDLTTNRYARHVGCKMAGFDIDAGGDGELVVTFNLVGAEETWETSPFDAAPTTVSLARINNFDGVVVEGGVSSSIITKASVNVDFGLDTRAELIPIGAGGVRTAIPEGGIKISGNVTAHFDDDGYTLLGKGIAGTESSLKLTFTASATSVFELEFQEVEFERRGVPIENPEGLLINLAFNAFYTNGSESSAVVARVSNATASYDLV